MNDDPADLNKAAHDAYFQGGPANIPTTHGIPYFYLSTVKMFRAAFPRGMTIDSPDYNAVCSFLDSQGYPYRAIAHILDFSFQLGYSDVLCQLGFITDEKFRSQEIARIQTLLRPHGLDSWLNEDDYGQPKQSK
jgi:hypothetical protein